jgi:hypothetical protein
MIRKLILVSLLLSSGYAFSDMFNSQNTYQQEMLKQQQEQTRIMQMQQQQQQDEMMRQRYSHDNNLKLPCYNGNFY